MSIIEAHTGCPSIPATGAIPCEGPFGEYYTVFGTELRFLKGHAALAALVGAGVFYLLYTLMKKGKISFSLWGSAIVAVLATAIFFFVFAYLVPVRVVY